MPFRQFVLKVTSRCDLACDHCYVYEHADQSWRRRPKVMARETVAMAADRMAEHARAHALRTIHVILHGGEPLLAGHERLEETIVRLRDAVRGICELDLRVHTNGVSLDERFCRMFADHDVRVGVSLDGGRRANDLHRRYADGRSSYDRVVRAVDRLGREFPDIYAGLLCTIDIGNDPVPVYEALVALRPPVVDFLLPHATWDHPPPRPAGVATPYADWLIAIHDRWRKDGEPVRVRMFESIIRTTQGQGSLTESLGLDECDLAVIETDGEYEQADSLKTSFSGAPATGCDVFSHTLDDVARSPAIAARLGGLEGLCDTCRACPVVESCGGGLYAHRHRVGTGFQNPSVFCDDLMKLITHVRSQAEVRPRAGIRVRAGVRAERGREGAAPAAHTIPGPDLAALAAGYGDAATMTHLAASQTSARRLLISSVYKLAGPGVADAWKLLTELDRGHPDAVREVFDHPYVRVWAARCIARGQWAHPETRYLSNIAAAAALRAGVAARLAVATRGGSVPLPAMGSIPAGRAQEAIIETGPGVFAVATEDRRWEVRLDEPAAAGDWRPISRLTADGVSMALDDVDPYRDCYDHAVAPRLSPERLARWQAMFAEAWEVVKRDHSRYAPALAAGLRVLTPLVAPGGDVQASATARHAFGAIGVALPGRPDDLAMLMIHEFQHVKLGAVLDLTDLFDGTDEELYHVSWRQDPRPLEGVFQGTYAHMAVTEVWKARTRPGMGHIPEKATENYLRWRDGTLEAVDTLARSGSLTEVGRQFVAGMRAAARSWLDD
ncbi:FxsB family cyclophane-forming radical SAM/SPASM peptide maturase [Sphaerisporangium corydalis]|uniref:FxsB family cyclophane-forming radical SAM/SPASM peptide maturase n=1 Tax=Sphaerisporangium corydalis TaxID=1441875 RepID=A0ABV9E990_9ACTN|nr:FxsB family cyclophane-forming radical SAM/SPASM peptide maturase [Sphaerisporangium corydalis]